MQPGTDLAGWRELWPHVALRVQRTRTPQSLQRSSLVYPAYPWKRQVRALRINTLEAKTLIMTWVQLRIISHTVTRELGYLSSRSEPKNRGTKTAALDRSQMDLLIACMRSALQIRPITSYIVSETQIAHVPEILVSTLFFSYQSSVLRTLYVVRSRYKIR